MRGKQSLLIRSGKTSGRWGPFGTGLKNQVVFGHTDPRGGNDTQNTRGKSLDGEVWLGGLLSLFERHREETAEY